METIIITGVNGLLGMAVERALRDRFQIVGFDKKMDPDPPAQIEIVCVDLTSDSSVHHGFERVAHAYGRRIASVIHLAAYYDFEGAPSPLYDEVTVKGTQRLIRALKEFEVEQFLFSSTMLVHAPTEPGKPIDEDWPLEPKWDYPRSKVETEELIKAERGSIPVVLLRIAGVYSDYCDSIPIAQQIRRIFERQFTAYAFPGDVRHGQAFVHIDDVVDCITRCVLQRHALGLVETLLVGETQTDSYDDLQRAIAQHLHGEGNWQTESIPKALAKTGAWLQDKWPGAEDPFIKPWMIDMADDHYELDISRARSSVGWEPRHRLIDTIPSMCESLLADPAKWYERHGFSADAVPSAAHSR